MYRSFGVIRLNSALVRGFGVVGGSAALGGGGAGIECLVSCAMAGIGVPGGRLNPGYHAQEAMTGSDAVALSDSTAVRNSIAIVNPTAPEKTTAVQSSNVVGNFIMTAARWDTPVYHVQGWCLLRHAGTSVAVPRLALV